MRFFKIISAAINSQAALLPSGPAASGDEINGHDWVNKYRCEREATFEKSLVTLQSNEKNEFRVRAEYNLQGSTYDTDWVAVKKRGLALEEVIFLKARTAFSLWKSPKGLASMQTLVRG